MGSFAYRSWVEISLAQIAANFGAVKDVVGDAVEVMPVVKADAYRHGAIEVSRRLVAEGARWLEELPARVRELEYAWTWTISSF